MRDAHWHCGRVTAKPEVTVSLTWIKADEMTEIVQGADSSEAAESPDTSEVMQNPDASEALGNNDAPEIRQSPDGAEPAAGVTPQRYGWKVQMTEEEVNHDKKGRQRVRPQKILQGAFEGQFPARETSYWLRHPEMMLLHDDEAFSPALWKFIAVCKKMDLDGHTFLVHRLCQCFNLGQDAMGRAHHSAADFLQIPGWLDLKIAPAGDPTVWEQYALEDGTKASIVSGFWMHPQAPSIMTENIIDGLIMDTTFKVIRRYHTAILMGVSHNVGIPLAVSFGPNESIELYDTFYTAFDSLNIDLRIYILESDQGSALKAVGTRHTRHLFCLRHVLKSLENKCGRFASLVGNLIRARSRKELDVLIELYTPDWAEVCQNAAEEEKQLRRCLAKVGLVMRDGTLCYEDAERTRWKQVSMLERVGTHMPTTSNTIECTNGHLNGDTPRHNTFWGSLHRIAGIFSVKIENFSECVWHNLKYERGKAERRCALVLPERMKCEMEFFQTNERDCLCGETKFPTDMYRVQVHCSHRLDFWRQMLL
jgi:hypothetical protein